MRKNTFSFFLLLFCFFVLIINPRGDNMEESSFILEIKSENKPVCDSGAYASFKKLILESKER